MSKPLIDPAVIEAYHAHVYYGPCSRPAAASLREQLEAAFDVAMGRWRDEPVGPHPLPMYQVAFAAAEFPRVVPWLMLNRGELTILVHPRTGDELADHGHHALWLGEKLELNLDFLKRS